MREATCKEFLPYHFSQTEMLDLGRELAKQSTEKHTLEDDKKRITSEFKAKIDAREAEIGAISGKLYAGYEYRNIECRIAYHSPSQAYKTISRIDTGELVREMPMTASELQEVIPFPAPENTSDENIHDFFIGDTKAVSAVMSQQTVDNINAIFEGTSCKVELSTEGLEVEEPASGEVFAEDDRQRKLLDEEDEAKWERERQEYAEQEVPEEPHEVPTVETPAIVPPNRKRKVKTGWPGGRPKTK